MSDTNGRTVAYYPEETCSASPEIEETMILASLELEANTHEMIIQLRVQFKTRSRCFAMPAGKDKDR